MTVILQIIGGVLPRSTNYRITYRNLFSAEKFLFCCINLDVKYYHLLLILLVLSSCKSKPNKEIIETIPLYHPLGNKNKIDSLLDNVINKGDTSAYFEVSGAHFIEEANIDFLYYSTIMANKYNFHKAYYDTYQILTWRNPSVPFDSLDEKTKNFALYYLVRSYELGYNQSINLCYTRNIRGESTSNRP